MKRTPADRSDADVPGLPARASAQQRRPVIGVDLFAGAGGLSLGALSAGIRIVAAVEQDRSACATYRHNFIDSGRTTTQLFETNILELDPKEVMKRTELVPGTCDILLGGPPCQGFSSHRLNDSGVNDPRNELLLRYFEYVRILRPRFFLVENVPGLLWPRHEEFLNRFYQLAEANDYDLPKPFLLNARSFGVPQNRRRVFLFGTDRRRREACLWPPEASHVPPTRVIGDDGQEDPRPTWRSARVVFDAPARLDDHNDVHMRHSAALTRIFEQTPVNGGSRRQSGRVLRCHEGHSGHSDVYGRIDPGQPGPTMTTACINPSKGRFVHPTEPHGITLRQAARFQTFPDWFEFKGGLMAGGVQVGNAVPVEMAAALLTPVAFYCGSIPPAHEPVQRGRRRRTRVTGRRLAAAQS